MKNKSLISLGQIFILILGIVAIGYSLGSEVRVVSASSTYDYYANEMAKNNGNTKAVSGTNIPASKDGAPKGGLEPTMAGKFLGLDPIKEDANSEPFSGTAGSTWDALSSSLMWAGVAYFASSWITGYIWDENPARARAVTWAMTGGIATGKFAYTLLQKGGALENVGFDALGAGGNAALWGGAVAIGIFLLLDKETTTETVTYTCEPWEAPIGGSQCEKCNEQGELPCSEYQCRSLGQSCRLQNPGTSEAVCTWVNRKDVKPPVIEPRTESLLDNYEYTPDNAMSPPDRGVIINYEKSTDNCVPAFTALSFGINTDEPSRCRLDYVRKRNISEMAFSFGGSNTFKYNHTQIMSLPGPSAFEAENLTIQNDGKFEVFLKCEDSNGNQNEGDFVFKFCVDAGPDVTAPRIVSTDLENGVPVSYGTSEVDLKVYVDEPAECRWSRLDVDYDEMEGRMDCALSVLEINAQMLYECRAELTGLKDNEENQFYFKCSDQPKKELDRNTNTESYEYMVRGTSELAMDSLEPNGTIRDSTSPIKVTLSAVTRAGADNGKATCFFKEQRDSNYEMFYYEGKENSANEHFQDQYLTEGEYNYSIKCIDEGGNYRESSVAFKVESDRNAPVIIRAYKEGTNLKIVTNEEAECYFDTNGCDYDTESGSSLTTTDGYNHFSAWETGETYFIKCFDEYGIGPSYDKCSMKIKPYDLGE